MAQVKTKNGFLDWLVNGAAKKVEPANAGASSTVEPEGIAPAAVAHGGTSSYMDSSGDDFEEFRQHLAQPKRPFRRPGISIKAEYELWLAAKALGPAPAAKPRTGLGKFLLGEKAE
jgi:hypothetical protein